MQFTEAALAGVYIIKLDRKRDERGYFARVYCREEFTRRGLCTEWTQTSTSFNFKKGTLRGLHFQAAPYSEAKLVRCNRGAIYDVAVDLRVESPTFCRSIALELSESNETCLYLPAGLAHGFQTLVDSSEVFYQVSVPFQEEAGRGINYHDPRLKIDWPLVPPVSISKRDLELPLLDQVLEQLRNSAIVE